jgi:hypothetical protein
VEIDLPRNWASRFEPQFVKNRQRRLNGVDEIVMSIDSVQRPPLTSQIGPSDHVLLHYQPGVPHQPLGYQVRVFDEVCRMIDNPGHQEMTVLQLGIVPDRPFMLVRDLTNLTVENVIEGGLSVSLGLFGLDERGRIPQ